MTCLMTPYIGKWALFEISRTVRMKPFSPPIRGILWKKDSLFKTRMIFSKIEWDELLTLGPLLLSGSKHAGNTCAVKVGKCFQQWQVATEAVRCDSPWNGELSASPHWIYWLVFYEYVSHIHFFWRSQICFPTNRVKDAHKFYIEKLLIC